MTRHYFAMPLLIVAGIMFGSPLVSHAIELPTTNLVARYVAGTGIHETEGRITQWDDTSGSGHHLMQLATTARPYLATDWLGRPTSRFNYNEANWMHIPSSVTFNTRSQTVWIVKAGGGTNSSFFNPARYTAGPLRYTGSPLNMLAGKSVTTVPMVLEPQIVGVAMAATSSVVYTTDKAIPLAAYAAATRSGGTLGTLSTTSPTANNTFKGDMYEILIYAGEQSEADRDATRAYLTETYGLPVNLTRNLVFEGASNTQGFKLNNRSYPVQAYELRGATHGWSVSNRGVNGSGVASLVKRGPALDAKYYQPTMERNVLMVLVGRNDLTSTTSAAVYDQLVSYVQARTAYGWEVWVGTTAASGNAAFQVKTDEYNARIRGTIGNGIIADASAARVIDFAAHPLFNDYTDPLNRIYYQSDGLHLTNAGAGVFAEILAPFLLVEAQ